MANPTAARSATLVIGDIHGELDRTLALLRRAHLIDEQRSWIGGATALWCVGDFIDRGPAGLQSIDLFRRLQDEAAVDGGHVDAVIGNHDVLLLLAKRFGGQYVAIRGRNGGHQSELEDATPEQLSWLATRPALARVDGTLIAHADSYAYTEYGTTVAHVNHEVASVLATPNRAHWDRLLDNLSERNAFRDPTSGRVRLIALLATYGARRLVHGHTPISDVMGVDVRTVKRPLAYADGKCVNVDGGMAYGGDGFLYRLPTESE